MNFNPSVVYLNLYDLVFDEKNYNKIEKFGLYHSGVQIGNEEYGFGGGEKGTGVWKQEPRKNIGNARFKENIYMGLCNLDKYRVESIIDEMKRKYPASSYHLLHKNCNHFADDLIYLTTGKHIPDYINRPANAGAKLSPLLGIFISSLKTPKSDTESNKQPLQTPSSTLSGYSSSSPSSSPSFPSNPFSSSSFPSNPFSSSPSSSSFHSNPVSSSQSSSFHSNPVPTISNTSATSFGDYPMI